MQNKLCEYCKCNFSLKPSRFKRTRFCSRKCRINYGADLNILRTQFFENIQVARPDDCHVWTGRCSSDGYGLMWCRKEGLMVASRLVWEYTHGPIPDGKLVCHQCDNPPCCNVKHLFLGTNKDNITDMVRKGRGAKGETSGKSKLTELTVIEIRKLYSTGNYTLVELGKKFNVSHQNISSVVKKETWNHIKS